MKLIVSSNSPLVSIDESVNSPLVSTHDTHCLGYSPLGVNQFVKQNPANVATGVSVTGLLQHRFDEAALW